MKINFSCARLSFHSDKDNNSRDAKNQKMPITRARINAHTRNYHFLILIFVSCSCCSYCLGKVSRCAHLKKIDFLLLVKYATFSKSGKNRKRFLAFFKAHCRMATLRGGKGVRCALCRMGNTRIRNKLPYRIYLHRS